MGTTYQNGHFPRSVYTLQDRLEECKEEHKSTLALMSRDWIRKNHVKEANKHSIKLEVVGETKSNRAKKALADMTHRQDLAWEYALEHIAPEQQYTPKDLAVIARLLAPHARYHPATGFRLDDVTITGASHHPPSPMKVEQEITTLIERVHHMRPLQKAIYSHFHIARIHPFEDGNGRTSRVVQNSIMCGAGYLPIPVQIEQRDLYISLLDEAAKGYYAGNHDYLHTFSEFLVSNLKGALKKAKHHPLNRLAM